MVALWRGGRAPGYLDTKTGGKVLDLQEGQQYGRAYDHHGDEQRKKGEAGRTIEIRDGEVVQEEGDIFAQRHQRKS